MAQCTHYWQIETTNAQTARGECRKCHIKKVFENSNARGLTYNEQNTIMFNPSILKELLPDFKGQRLEQGSRLR